MGTNEVIQQLESINSILDIAVKVAIFSIGIYMGIFIKDIIHYFLTKEPINKTKVTFCS